MIESDRAALQKIRTDLFVVSQNTTPLGPASREADDLLTDLIDTIDEMLKEN